MRLSLSQMSAKYLARDFWNIIRTKDETERQEFFVEIVYRELEVKFPAELRKCIKKYVFPLYFFCSFCIKM